MASKNYIITGAPGTGKTSIVEELHQRGYACHGEIAREVITEEQEKKSGIHPASDVLAFTKLVVDKMKNRQHVSATDELCFYDRGLPDSAGYLMLDNIEVPEYLIQEIKNATYQKVVFITPFWEEIYLTDGVRFETADEAKAIAMALRQSYTHFGYNLMEIPKGTVDERVDFVLNEINKLG
jgi:predicted ATPase